MSRSNYNDLVLFISVVIAALGGLLMTVRWIGSLVGL